MAKIALCWELGGGYGHLTKLCTLAVLLKREQHDVVLIASNVVTAHRLVEQRCAGLTVLQAPVNRVYRQRQGFVAQTYADILTQSGYLNVEALAPLLEGWRALLELCNADLVVADHAPTAVLAAKTLQLPFATAGTGFQLPPAKSPMPSIQPWKPASEKNRLLSEQHVLGVVNERLHQYQCSALQQLSDLFAGGRHFICGLPELDHYGRDDPELFFDALNGPPQTGASPGWPGVRKQRVFAYLSADFSRLEMLLAALKASDASVLIVVRGLPADACRRLSDANCHVCSELLDIQQVLSEADWIVSHGGHGLTTQAMLGGVPMLIVPQQIEQCMLAWRLEQQQLAVVISGKSLNIKGILSDTLRHRRIQQTQQLVAGKSRELPKADMLVRQLLDLL